MLSGYSIVQLLAVTPSGTNHWIIAKDGVPIDDRTEVPRGINELFAAVKNIPLDSVPFTFGIVETATVANTVCPVALHKRGQYTKRDNRQYGIAAGVCRGETPSVLAVVTGWYECEPLAAVLGNYYGTPDKPAPTPTAAEIERQERERIAKEQEAQRRDERARLLGELATLLNIPVDSAAKVVSALRALANL